jgi:hypothetical protein
MPKLSLSLFYYVIVFTAREKLSENKKGCGKKVAEMAESVLH